MVVYGIQVGLAVVAPVLLYGSYPALREADENMSKSADSPRPETASADWADTNVRVVQDKLREAGSYFDEIDGAYSSELAAALGRY